MECAFEGMLYGAVDDEQHLFKYPWARRLELEMGFV